MTPALTQLPRFSRGVSNPKGLVVHEEKTLSARTALAVWLGLSAVGWAAIIGLGYWII